MTVPLADQIAEIRRELALRQKVYARWLDSGRMQQWQADKFTGAMQGVLATLLWLQQNEKEIRAALPPGRSRAIS